jgi:hypothetical protein
MNEWDERDRAEFAVIDSALQAYPLAPAPPTLAPAVMKRIAALSPAPRFRLLWIDYVLGLFGAGMLALVVLFWQVLLPNDLVTLLQVSTVPFDISSTMLWFVSLLAGMVLLICCIAVAALVLKPSPARRAHFRQRRWVMF